MQSYLQFLGAARTVTGSRHVVSHQGKVIMLDCGLFQGLKTWREKNWEPFPTPPGFIEDIILSHAHIDHSGYLPRLCRSGFNGRVFATPSTVDLCSIMLPDSAHIQEEDARFANKMGFSRHRPALPLYSREDAETAVGLLRPIRYGQTQSINARISFDLLDAGHILGSAMVRLTLERPDGPPWVIVYTGDLGRFGDPTLHDPSPVEEADFLILESTYGNRLHEPIDVQDALGAIIRETAARGGLTLIPAFSVGRTQDILYQLRLLQESGRIPLIPVFMDSPLAIKATEITCAHPHLFPESLRRHTLPGTCPVLCHHLQLAARKEQSMALNDLNEPAIILSASGMCEAGRILHHLKLRLPDPRHSVVFVGYQAEGTRGRRILDGEPEIKIHGQMVPVRAAVHRVDAFSAHADWSEILRWLGGFRRPPRLTCLVHGEPANMDALAARIESQLGWPTWQPRHLERIDLEHPPGGRSGNPPSPPPDPPQEA